MTAALVAMLSDLPQPTRPPGQVSRTIDRVLARPEYRHLKVVHLRSSKELAGWLAGLRPQA